jgi:hypothetical protein
MARDIELTPDAQQEILSNTFCDFLLKTTSSLNFEDYLNILWLQGSSGFWQLSAIGFGPLPLQTKAANYQLSPLCSQ